MLADIIPKEFMPPAAPVTQRDVARACGVHPSTICLALANSPSIPVPTRQRVQEMAQKLGYKPNASARNLAYLRGDKKEAVDLPLAWINQEPQRGFWKTHPAARRYFEGARHRAEELGYYLEEFWVHEPGMRLVRLAQILRARGVQGAIFPCLRSFDPDLFQPLWSEFSMVAFNDHRAGAWVDVVCPDHYHNLGLILRDLKLQGFRRIGLVLSDGFDAATDGLAACRFLRRERECPAIDHLPLCLWSDEAGDGAVRVGGWLREHRPDVVICSDAATQMLVRAQNGNLPTVQLQLGGAEAGPGIDERAEDVGAAAIECLVHKMRRFERGLGGATCRYLIKGSWRASAECERRMEAVA